MKNNKITHTHKTRYKNTARMLVRNRTRTLYNRDTKHSIISSCFQVVSNG